MCSLGTHLGSAASGVTRIFPAGRPSTLTRSSAAALEGVRIKVAFAMVCRISVRCARIAREARYSGKTKGMASWTVTT